MNIKIMILAATMVGYVGLAHATSKTPPMPPVKPKSQTEVKAGKKTLNEACKMIKGKKRCHKSPYKNKMEVQPYQGKPKSSKKTN